MKKVFLILSMITVLFIGFGVHAEEQEMKESKKLVVYFSRTGEQYSVGNIVKGNTAIIAEMIANKIGADLFEVKLKNDTYPTTYKELTEVALEEKNTQARPEFEGDIENFSDYDTVFIGTPNWWADMPMVLYTFIEAHDWRDKTVASFVTHEGSGLASIPDKIKTAANPKIMLKSFEIYGHVAQNEQDKAQEKVEAWLEKLGF